jgi:hypothetical protein
MKSTMAWNLPSWAWLGRRLLAVERAQGDPLVGERLSRTRRRCWQTKVGSLVGVGLSRGLLAARNLALSGRKNEYHSNSCFSRISPGLLETDGSMNLSSRLSEGRISALVRLILGRVVRCRLECKYPFNVHLETREINYRTPEVTERIRIDSNFY